MNKLKLFKPIVIFINILGGFMQNDILSEKQLKEVVLNRDDIKNLRDFFSHFKIEMVPELDAVLTRWEKNPESVTPEVQEELKVALCSNMLISNHKMFSDELFEPILDNSRKIVYDATFKKELENQLAVDENSGN